MKKWRLRNLFQGHCDYKKIYVSCSVMYSTMLKKSFYDVFFSQQDFLKEQSQELRFFNRFL